MPHPGFKGVRGSQLVLFRLPIHHLVGCPDDRERVAEREGSYQRPGITLSGGLPMEWMGQTSQRVHRVVYGPSRRERLRCSLKLAHQRSDEPGGLRRNVSHHREGECPASPVHCGCG
jgi:hypothetical protein